MLYTNSAPATKRTQSQANRLSSQLSLRPLVSKLPLWRSAQSRDFSPAICRDIDGSQTFWLFGGIRGLQFTFFSAAPFRLHRWSSSPRTVFANFWYAAHLLWRAS